MEEKCRFTMGAFGRAKVLLAGALKSHYVFAAALLIAAGATMHFAGGELFQPAFAEQSDISQMQMPTGNLYYRSVSESMSMVALHGSGANSPTSHYRSMSESMSVTSIQGKVPNSYSRSMSEQASLTTGMPSSAPAGSQLRATPAPATPHYASSNQRIDERLTPALKMLGKRGDTTVKNTVGGTPILATELLGSTQAGSPGQLSETGEISDEASPDDNSALVRQLDTFNEYMLMQKSLENAALANLSTSAVLLFGAAMVVVAKHPAVSRGRMQKKMYAIFLLKRRAANDNAAAPQERDNGSVTYVLVLVLVIFTVSSIVNAVDPSAGRAFAEITYVGAGSSSVALSNSNVLPTLPSGLQQGDLMIAYYYSDDTSGTISISAGWTQLYNDVGSGGHTAVWYRVFQSGDSAPTFTSSRSGTGNPNNRPVQIAQIAAWRGVDTTTPIDAQGTISTNGSQQDIGPISGITLGARDVVIVVGGKDADWTSVATLSGDSVAWNEIGETSTTSGTDGGLVWDYAIDDGSGTTVTSKTFSVTGGSAAAGKGVMFSLNVVPPITKAMTEQFTVTDVVARTVTQSRSALEQLSVTDAIATSNARPILESLNVTDIIARSVGQQRSMAEQLAVQETMSIASTKALSEQLGITDAIARTSTVSGVISEQLTVTDDIATASSRSLTEQLGITNSIQRSIATTRTLSEQLVVTDTISKSISITLSEQVTLIESIARSSASSRSLSEQMTVQDSITKAVAVAMIEQLGLQDALARAAVVEVAVSEQLNLTDFISISTSKSMSESLGLSESLSRSVVQSSSFSEQMTIAEFITSSVAKPIIEQLGIADSTARSVTLSKTTSEQLAMTDVVEAQVSKTIVEQLTIQDTISVSTLVSRSATESISLIESVATSPTKSVSEQLVVSDTIAIAITTSIADQLAVSDSISAITSGPVFVTDQMGMTDSIAIIVSKNLADNLILSDTSMVSGSTATSDSMALYDALARSVILARAVSDSLALSDTTSAAPAVLVIITESMSINDSFADIALLVNLNLSEPLVLVQSFATDFAASFNQVDSEGIIIGDSVVLSLGPTGQNRNITDSMEIQDSLIMHISDDSNRGSNRDRTFTRLLSESLFVSSVANLGVPAGSEGKIVIKDITESLTFRVVQPQPLHQRVITINDITVAISIVDVRSAATLGTAVATLNFEFINKGITTEELVLRFWYPDPAGGDIVYEAEQTITAGAGESIVEEVKIPFSSPGLYNVVIEVESEDGILSTTDIVVDVPWLTVYLYILIVIAIIVVLASIAYVIYAMRMSGLFIIGGK